MTSGSGGATSGVGSEEHGEVIPTPVAGGLTSQPIIQYVRPPTRVQSDSRHGTGTRAILRSIHEVLPP